MTCLSHLHRSSPPRAALVAVLAAYVLRRRRQRSVTASAASVAGDASAAGKAGWDKDVEAGSAGGNSPPGGSAWGSLSSAPPPPGEASSLRDSAMGSRATASSGPSGDGSGHGTGSGSLQLSESAAGDTDVRRLPAGWATIDFGELELSTVLGEEGQGAGGRAELHGRCTPWRTAVIASFPFAAGPPMHLCCCTGCHAALPCCSNKWCCLASLLQARAALGAFAWPSGARPRVRDEGCWGWEGRLHLRLASAWQLVADVPVHDWARHPLLGRGSRPARFTLLTGCFAHSDTCRSGCQDADAGQQPGSERRRGAAGQAAAPAGEGGCA